MSLCNPKIPFMFCKEMCPICKDNVKDYERNHSHYHCWDQVSNEDSDIEKQDLPDCGQSLESHKQCCLCDMAYKK